MCECECLGSQQRDAASAVAAQARRRVDALVHLGVDGGELAARRVERLGRSRASGGRALIFVVDDALDFVLRIVCLDERVEDRPVG